MKFEIKHYISGSVLFSLETKSLKLTLEAAVEAKTDLRGADLRGAYLTGADLTGADLRGADLTGAYLRGADLTGAYLTGAYLTGADLTGADLRGADLTGAYLTGADLRGAYLRGAYLTGADLTGADLTGAGEEKIEIIRFLSIGPIGSRQSYLNVFFTKKGIFTHTGCFRGTLEELEAKAQREHGDNEHGVAYAAAVTFIRAIATTPKKKKAAA